MGAANLFCKVLDKNSVNMSQLAPPACESDFSPQQGPQNGGKTGVALWSENSLLFYMIREIFFFGL